MNVRRVLRLFKRHFPALLRAFFVVAAFRIALLFFKYRQLSRHIRIKRPARPPSPEAPYVAAWAVKNVARIIPFASCLTQALSVQYMLAQLGAAGTIRVGVRTDEANTVHAHAWVVFEDVVVIGAAGKNLDDYTVLTDLVPVGDG